MSSDFKKDLSGSEPDAAALERVWAGVKAKEQPRGLAPGWVFVVAAAVLVVVGGMLVNRVQSPQPVELQLAGGSSVKLEGEAKFEPVGPRALALHAGVAHFSLQRGPWAVTSRHLRLEVASAVFTLESGGPMDSLTVTRGEARVWAPGVGAMTLREGQSFATQASGPTWDWESLARSGDLVGAWRKLGHAGVNAQAGTANPEVRMLLSDVAASGGDEALSRELLHAVMAAGEGGAARGLAAYTLGKRLQTEGKAEEAREVFARSLELALPEELRGDVQERLVELERMTPRR